VLRAEPRSQRLAVQLLRVVIGPRSEALDVEFAVTAVTEDQRAGTEVLPTRVAASTVPTAAGLAEPLSRRQVLEPQACEMEGGGTGIAAEEVAAIEADSAQVLGDVDVMVMRSV